MYTIYHYFSLKAKPHNYRNLRSNKLLNMISFSTFTDNYKFVHKYEIKSKEYIDVPKDVIFFITYIDSNSLVLITNVQLNSKYNFQKLLLDKRPFHVYKNKRIYVKYPKRSIEEFRIYLLRLWKIKAFI